MKSFRSSSETISLMFLKSPPHRSFTMLSNPNGPASRLRKTRDEIGSRNSALYAASASGFTPNSKNFAPSIRASIIAWLAPFDPVGYMAWAASPSNATGPSTQLGIGSRSIIGFSYAIFDPRINAGTSNQSYFQSSK